MTSNAGFSVVAPISVTQALLDGRQQRVLLGLVEAVDLVEEEHRLPAAGIAPVGGALDHRAHLGAPGRRRRSAPRRPRRERSATIRASVVLPEPGGPYRTIECGRPCSIAVRSAEPGAEQVRLADELLEAARAHAHRQRPPRRYVIRTM